MRRSASADAARLPIASALVLVVDLHALQPLDDRFLELVGTHRLLGDLAQRDDRVLVAVAVERQVGAPRNLARALCGEQHQVETVGDLVDAIFDGHACHMYASSGPALCG